MIERSPWLGWSQTGPILTLRSARSQGGEYIDRVELDRDGTHYGGANQYFLGIRGFRVPPHSTTNSIGITMNPIPAGEFDMGTSTALAESYVRQLPALERDSFADEQPERRVRITRPFSLSATEVTISQFRTFVEATGYKTDAERTGKGATGPNERGEMVPSLKLTWREPGFPLDDDHPVVNVSWNDAVAFCSWLSRKEGKAYRLPTEAEWEYACRAGLRSPYASGDDPERLTTVGNVADGTARDRYPSWMTIPARDGFLYAAPVGTFQPNAFGLYDMTGNVWEWCADFYDPDYYSQRVGDDPRGPAQALERVRRGGWWNFDPSSFRLSDRKSAPPDFASNSLGFRVAGDLSPEEK